MTSMLRNYGGLISGGAQQWATVAPEGREGSNTEANRWASTGGITIITKARAYSRKGVDSSSHGWCE